MSSTRAPRNCWLRFWWSMRKWRCIIRWSGFRFRTQSRTHLFIIIENSQRSFWLSHSMLEGCYRLYARKCSGGGCWCGTRDGIYDCRRNPILSNRPRRRSKNWPICTTSVILLGYLDELLYGWLLFPFKIISSLLLSFRCYYITLLVVRVLCKGANWIAKKGKKQCGHDILFCCIWTHSQTSGWCC